MATLAASVLTLADLAKRMDPNGRQARIVELLGQTNEVLDDALWMEGNTQTGHRTTVRTGLPDVTWRLLNQGTTPSKSTTAQITEECGILDAWSEVDEQLVKISNDPAAFRLSEATPFIEAMNQEMAQTLFYGDSTTAPEEFLGLASRYNDLSAENAQNIIDAAGTGSDNCSVWLVVWGENSIHGIYPKGTQAGLVHNDYGLVTVETAGGTAAGTRMRAYQEQFIWNCGIALRDWRYVVRICNVDVSNLVAESSAADLIKSMIRATHRVPSLRMGKAAFYVNRSTAMMLDIQSRNAVSTGGGITYDNVNGQRIMSFRGIPIRTADQLTETESRVT